MFGSDESGVGPLGEAVRMSRGFGHGSGSSSGWGHSDKPTRWIVATVVVVAVLAVLHNYWPETVSAALETVLRFVGDVDEDEPLFY